ncbi:MAG TPA: glutaredoxin family protein [Microbacteriaceae bacterium]|nr:glutaredoxin family protein [Microbacteriaceae bacterium]
MGTRLTLIGRDGCHLCDDARAAVAEVLAHFPEVTFEELSIDSNPELRYAYADEIPVVLIDGAMHTYWRVDGERLTRALNSR